MKEQIVNFETGKLAGDNGFLKEWCNLAYSADDQKLYMDTGSYTDYPAPTQSLLQKWLREVHDIEILVYNSYYYKTGRKYYVDILFVEKGDLKTFTAKLTFDFYEEALEKGLQYALERINQQT